MEATFNIRISSTGLNLFLPTGLTDSPRLSAQRSASWSLSSASDQQTIWEPVQQSGERSDRPAEPPPPNVSPLWETEEWVTWPSMSSWPHKLESHSVFCGAEECPPHTDHSADVWAGGLQCVWTGALLQQQQNKQPTEEGRLKFNRTDHIHWSLLKRINSLSFKSPIKNVHVAVARDE